MNEQVREYVYATRGVPVSDAKGLISLPREKIVRCRDCDSYDHWDASGPYSEKHVCGHFDYLEIDPNSFCAWGERRE